MMVLLNIKCDPAVLQMRRATANSHALSTELMNGPNSNVELKFRLRLCYSFHLIFQGIHFYE